MEINYYFHNSAHCYRREVSIQLVKEQKSKARIAYADKKHQQKLPLFDLWRFGSIYSPLVFNDKSASERDANFVDKHFAHLQIADVEEISPFSSAPAKRAGTVPVLLALGGRQKNQINERKLKMKDQTIANLKEQFMKKGGLVGQILGAGLNRYVVVEETSTGLRVMGLFGTFLGSGAADEVVDVNNEEEAGLEDRSKWKGKFQDRWDAIAAKYPAINSVQ